MNRRALTAFVGVALSVAVGVALAPYIGALIAIALAVVIACAGLVVVFAVLKQVWPVILFSVPAIGGLIWLLDAIKQGRDVSDKAVANVVPWVLFGSIAIIALVQIVTSRSNSAGGLRRR